VKRTLHAFDREGFKHALRRRGTTARKIATVLGVEESAISRIARGLLPSATVRNDVARLLGVAPEHLWIPVVVDDAPRAADAV
jgi:transcriptional regulator with XRE-family HTH domain